MRKRLLGLGIASFDAGQMRDALDVGECESHGVMRRVRRVRSVGLEVSWPDSGVPAIWGPEGRFGWHGGGVARACRTGAPGEAPQDRRSYKFFRGQTPRNSENYKV
ncbi:hypothetical protein Cmtc_31240 [Cupriavidus sp. TKC]|nr:hypothetical protein Cmtc_31240 [Cupriavidus sp. TKC]